MKGTSKLLILLAFGRALVGCGGEVVPTSGSGTTGEHCAQHNPLRNVYFGDLHVHTTLLVRRTRLRRAAPRRSRPIALPRASRCRAAAARRRRDTGRRRSALDRPLDFAAVTDHSEFLGEVEACITPGSSAYDSENCQAYRGDSYSAVRRFGVFLTPRTPRRQTDICGADRQGCMEPASEVWQRIQNAANAAYDRSARCSFTSFVAYEYSASPGASTLHRNVIFRNDHVPLPTSVYEQPTAQGLWTQLKATCLDAGIDCDVLAIPHNSNESNGKMFHVEYPGATSRDEERAQAEFRVAMEPLVEIYQHKGDSECMNGLSGIVGQPDEQCEFEKRMHPPFFDCGDGTGQTGAGGQGCLSRFDFVRGALLAGLQERERLGVNPYQPGHHRQHRYAQRLTGGDRRGQVHRPPRHRRRHSRQAAGSRRADARRHHLRPRRIGRRLGRGELTFQHLRRPAPA